MLDAPVVSKLVSELWNIENTVPESKLHLLKLYHKAVDAKAALEDSVQQILLPLPQQNQVKFLRNCLEQLHRDSNFYHECPWWIQECIRGAPASYWQGELGEIGRFAGLSNAVISEAAYQIALGISSRTESANERIEYWCSAFALVNSMKSFLFGDLEHTLREYEENGDVFPYDNTPFEEEFASLCPAIITANTFDSSIYSLASHLAFVEDPQAGFTASPSFRWLSVLNPSVTDLISGLYEEEKAGYAPAIEWRDMLMVARDKMYETFYWDIRPDSKAKQDTPILTPLLQWQGSKTELAELGYALLEAGLIGGPREAALKALAGFFGQDLGNPAKHLQTLQKRKWDPSDKEPATPLLDRLGTALKILLKGKAVAPSKK
jgi:hypothetical protein